MAKILIIGASGLVGSRFVELYSLPGQLLTPTHQELDITNPTQTKDYLIQHQPETIINFSAYTNVSEAENQRGDKNGDCWKINAGGVSNLLGAIDKNTLFIQISTDMVFSGSSEDPGPYGEDHTPEVNSQNATWYGWTKAEAERLIVNQPGNWAILRLIYPVRAKFDKKLDYLRKQLQLFDQQKLWPLFTDQKVSICFIDEACLALEKIIESKETGIFHAGSSDLATPFELYSYLFAKTRGYHGLLKTHTLDGFLKDPVNSPIRYPKFGGLKVEETEKRLGIKFSTWKEIIDKLVEQGVSV